MFWYDFLGWRKMPEQSQAYSSRLHAGFSWKEMFE